MIIEWFAGPLAFQGQPPSVWPELIELVKYMFYIVATMVAAGVAWVARLVKQMIEAWLAKQQTAPERLASTVADWNATLGELKEELEGLHEEVRESHHHLCDQMSTRLATTEQRIAAFEQRVLQTLEQHRAQDIDGLRVAIQSLQAGAQNPSIVLERSQCSHDGGPDTVRSEQIRNRRQSEQ